jgi:hypothetical protein
MASLTDFFANMSIGNQSTPLPRAMVVEPKHSGAELMESEQHHALPDLVPIDIIRAHASTMGYTNPSQIFISLHSNLCYCRRPFGPHPPFAPFPPCAGTRSAVGFTSHCGGITGTNIEGGFQCMDCMKLQQFIYSRYPSNAHAIVSQLMDEPNSNIAIILVACHGGLAVDSDKTGILPKLVLGETQPSGFTEMPDRKLVKFLKLGNKIPIIEWKLMAPGEETCHESTCSTTLSVSGLKSYATRAPNPLQMATIFSQHIKAKLNMMEEINKTFSKIGRPIYADMSRAVQPIFGNKQTQVKIYYKDDYTKGMFLTIVYPDGTTEELLNPGKNYSTDLEIEAKLEEHRCTGALKYDLSCEDLLSFGNITEQIRNKSGGKSKQKRTQKSKRNKKSKRKLTKRI